MKLFDKLRQILIPVGEKEGSYDSTKSDDVAKAKEASIYEESQTTTEENKLKQVALLTPRENDLFLLLLEGLTLKESAKHLSIKYSTANTHMTSIYKKLRVNSRAELIINYHKLKG